MEPEAAATKAPPRPPTPIEYSDDITAIVPALAQAQSLITNAERDADNPYFGSTYATLASVWNVIREPLAKNDLCVIQGVHVEDMEPDSRGNERKWVDVTTMVFHKSSQWFRTTVRLPVVAMSRKKKDQNGVEQDNDADRIPGRITPQAIGSAITYGRRYGLEPLMGVAPEADDDDGNGGSGQKPGAKYTPIPDTGIFQDVIVAVTFRDQARADKSTFKIAKIETGEHGPLESYEKEGNDCAKVVGTGEVVRLHTERSKFGPKLKRLEKIPASTAGDLPDSSPAQASDPGSKGAEDMAATEARIFKGAPKPDDGAAYQWIKAGLEALTTSREIAILKNGCVKLKGEFWTAATKAMIQAAYDARKKTETENKGAQP